MPIASKMRTLGDAGLYKYKWCNNLREVEQVDIFFLKDIADTIRYLIGNNIGFLYHNKYKLFVCVPDSLTANVQHAVSQLFNSNIIVEYQNNSNIIDILSEELSVLLGEGNYSIEIDDEEQIITIDVPFAMSLNLDKIKIILNRTYLMNLDIELLDDGVPVTYTHLEYLDSSGTQYLDTGIMPTSTMTVTTELSPLTWDFVNMTWGSIAWLKVDNNLAFSTNYNMTHEANRPIMYWYGSNYAYFDRNYRHELGVKHSYIFDKNKLYQNGVLLSYIGNTSLPEQTFIGTTYPILVFAACWGGEILPRGGKRFWNFNIKDNDIKLIDLVPVLDANGTPCMYDKISRQCFYNQGTGTFGYRIKGSDEAVAPMSLRDPYYTAPSGVWAKLIAENELDIIADTDMQDGEGQGYTWFVNTGEAYEHFGIKEEPLNNI